MHEMEVPPKNSDSDSFLSSPSGPSAAILAKCPVISLVHLLTVEILLTIISPCSLWKQGIFRNSAKIEVPGVLNKVLRRGRSAPRSNPLPFYIPFYDRKGPPSYTFCWQWYPSYMPSLEICIPLNCCKCTAFKTGINHKTRPFTQLFSQPCNAFVSTFWAFLPTEMTVSLSFHILQQVKSQPSHILKAWKWYPFRVEPLRIGGHFREYPPGFKSALNLINNMSNSNRLNSIFRRVQV